MTCSNTADGSPLYSQGGGIFRFDTKDENAPKYYWYGVRYKGAEEYRADPSQTVDHSVFSGVTCYTSDNLTDWTYAGDVLTPTEIAKHGRHGWLGRMGVCYLPEISRYVLAIQCDNSVLFATSERPEGPFRWEWRKEMTQTIGTPNTGDQTVFTDPDSGKSYLVYSYGRGRNKIYVSEIGIVDGRPDLLDCTKVFEGKAVRATACSSAPAATTCAPPTSTDGTVRMPTTLWPTTFADRTLPPTTCR